MQEMKRYKTFWNWSSKMQLGYSFKKNFPNVRNISNIYIDGKQCLISKASYFIRKWSFRLRVSRVISHIMKYKHKLFVVFQDYRIDLFVFLKIVVDLLWILNMNVHFKLQMSFYFFISASASDNLLYIEIQL